MIQTQNVKVLTVLLEDADSGGTTEGDDNIIPYRDVRARGVPSVRMPTHYTRAQKREFRAVAPTYNAHPRNPLKPSTQLLDLPGNCLFVIFEGPSQHHELTIDCEDWYVQTRRYKHNC